MLRRLAIAFGIIAVWTIPASAEGWKLDADWVDPFVGDRVAIAITENEDGFRFGLFRSEDGRVRALYGLPESSFDRLPTDGRVLMIRPGSNRSVEIEAETIQRGVTEQAKSNGMVIRGLIWHGQDPAPTTGTLRNLLDSDTMFARFFTETGQTIDTSWDMTGSHEPIAIALGISVSVDPAEQAWGALVTETLVGTMARCNANGPNAACTDRLNACINILVEHRDKARFDACMIVDGVD